ncbi:MAG: hypothetical protein R3F65_16060 [bacterium]|nr:hypothetical protein [Myxococcales bacterium]MCB9541601.1 hypothetical protein [Myxococcales bacterium]MCB9552455.1 hypothetical protein [Myxococcales bacterium]
MWEMTAYAFFTAWSVAAVTLLGGWCLGVLRTRRQTSRHSDAISPTGGG